jgi:hypothetical protein
MFRAGDVLPSSRGWEAGKGSSGSTYDSSTRSSIIFLTIFSKSSRSVSILPMSSSGLSVLAVPKRSLSLTVSSSGCLRMNLLNFSLNSWSEIHFLEGE